MTAARDTGTGIPPTPGEIPAQFPASEPGAAGQNKTAASKSGRKADRASKRQWKTRPIRKGRRADKALAYLMRGHARDYADHLGRLLKSKGSEGAHQTRVAIRRMRATLAAMSPITKPSLRRALTDDLREMFRQIGVLRDSEVLAQLYRAAPNAAELAEEVTRLRRTLCQELKSRHAARLPRRIDATFSGKSWRQTTGKSPVEHLATRALSKAWTKSLKHGPDLTTLPMEVQHDLRKCLKVFRYMVEDFAPIWPSASTEPFLTPLRALQEDLGQLNDISLAEAAGLPVDAQTKAAILARAAALWRDLQAIPPWWQRS